MRQVTIPIPDECSADVSITLHYPVEWKPLPKTPLDGALDVAVNKLDRELTDLAEKPTKKVWKQKEPVEGKWLCDYCTEGLPSSRSCKAHERFCPKNPNGEENKGLKAARSERLRGTGKNKETKDDLRCPVCKKKCKNVQGLGVHMAKRHKNPDNKQQDSPVVEKPDIAAPPPPASTDTAGLPEETIKNIQAGIDQHKPGAIATITKKATGFLDSLVGKKDDSPVEEGMDVWDYKYHHGLIIKINHVKQYAQVYFESIGEERSFNFDGCRRMIRGWKERSNEAHNEYEGLN